MSVKHPSSVDIGSCLISEIRTPAFELTPNLLCRYFTRSQLRELFVLNDPLRSETQVQLEKMHTKQLSQSMSSHVAFLLGTDMVFGVSHHDLMFSTEEEKEEVSQQQREFITHQVHKARILREKESEIIMEDLKRNPHLVPDLTCRSAAQRNLAARMATAHLPPVMSDFPPSIWDAPQMLNGGGIENG